MPLNPYRIEIPQERLDGLHQRLRHTVWADTSDGPGWAYGVPGDYLHELVDHWIEHYDWREHESAMNRWPHLRGDVDGVTLHVLHERGSGSAPVPLILTHGWPWTFWDFAKVIEPLAHPERFGGDPEDGFDVVVPSLPGSVFSSPTPSGIGWRQTADLWVQLMTGLGYGRFAAHGGDSGAFVSAQLAHAHADRLIGAHLTYPSLLDPAAVFSREDFDADEVDDFDRQRDPTSNMTHFLVHMLEPQTLAWALQDSPVGLAAWMLQRRAAWSDCDGDVERRFTKDELITSFALYWLTGTVSSSLRFYADSFREPWQPSHDRKPTLQAPTGIAVFPRELSHVRAPEEDWEQFAQWADDIFAAFTFDPNGIDENHVLHSWNKLDEYVDDMVARRRHTLTDDLLSDLIRVEEDGDRLSADELRMLAGGLLLAGTDTTRNQVAASVDVFCDHLEQWALLKDRPELAPQAVEETMRHSPIACGTLRTVTEDTELAGFTFPAGTFLVVNTFAANRDGAVYDDPDRFDITREGAPAVLTFGGGIHYCLGANLARKELVEALKVLAQRMPNPVRKGPAPWKPMLGLSGPTAVPIEFARA